jgi:PspAB-like protein
MRVDKYGYLWIVLEGSYMDDILTGIAATSDTIAEKGFSNQLLITAFEFLSTKRNNRQYLIYNYKLSRFYPFVPSDNKTRRIEHELKIMAAVADELPFERDMTLWYPIWELPF